MVEPTLLLDLVPRISEFANSQNQVNMADFSANDPFHVEIEKLSRTRWAPGKAGTGDMTRWFYERARGQYADAHARERTPARQRQFKQINPLGAEVHEDRPRKVREHIGPASLDRFLRCGEELPRVHAAISKRGAGFKPDQGYFENLVAKAILFRSSEKLIGSLQLGGYRAQTVTYTLAKLLHVTGQRIDLRAIWRSQELSSALGSLRRGTRAVGARERCSRQPAAGTLVSGPRRRTAGRPSWIWNGTHLKS